MAVLQRAHACDEDLPCLPQLDLKRGDRLPPVWTRYLGRRRDPSGFATVTLENGAAQVEATGLTFEEALARAGLRAVEKA